MLKSGADNLRHMFVRNGIKDALSIALCLYKLALLQKRQLVAHARLRHVKPLGNIAHTHCAAVHQQEKYREARIIPEYLKNSCQILQSLHRIRRF